MKRLRHPGKILILTLAGLTALSVVALIIMVSSDRNSNKGLPRPPAGIDLPGPVKNQILTALEEAGKKPSSANLGTLGMVYHSNAFYTEAKKCYTEAIKSDPENWKWYHYNGYLCSELGETEEAIGFFQRQPN